MGIQFSDRVENIVRKEEIARYEQFLLFPQCFQKLSVVDAWECLFMEYRVTIFSDMTGSSVTKSWPTKYARSYTVIYTKPIPFPVQR